MIKFLDTVSGIYLAGMAGWLMFCVLGEVLTGGLRLHARAATETMDPFAAASLFVWLVCAIYSGVRQVRAAA